MTIDDLAGAKFFKSANEAVDLGLISFSTPVFQNVPSIALDAPILLQDVMALGFPDVPGFLPALAAEKALISSRLTATRGAIASVPFEFWARTELLLITARVRGGFSGGPILNEKGDCVGVISRDPVSQSGDRLDEAIHLYDNLGYGTAIPATLVRAFAEDAHWATNQISVEMETKGIKFATFEE